MARSIGGGRARWGNARGKVPAKDAAAGNTTRPRDGLASWMGKAVGSVAELPRYPPGDPRRRRLTA
jgi:hypothetical protein